MLYKTWAVDMKKRAYRFLVVGVCFCLTMAGTCNVTAAENVSPEFPSDWGGLVEVADGQCLGISGTYEYRAEEASANRYRRPLLQKSFADLFYSKFELIARRDITHFTIISAGDNTFEVSFWSPSEVVSTKAFSGKARDFECGVQRLVFSRSYQGGTEGHSFSSREVKSVFRATDGSLIVSVHEVTTGNDFFVFPYKSDTLSWYRFRKK